MSVASFQGLKFSIWILIVPGNNLIIVNSWAGWIMKFFVRRLVHLKAGLIMIAAVYFHGLEGDGGFIESKTLEVFFFGYCWSRRRVVQHTFRGAHSWKFRPPWWTDNFQDSARGKSKGPIRAHPLNYLQIRSEIVYSFFQWIFGRFFRETVQIVQKQRETCAERVESRWTSLPGGFSCVGTHQTVR